MTNRAYLAFETGGTKLVAAVALADGKLIESRIIARAPSNRASHSLSQLIETAMQLRKGYEACGYGFAGIGFGYGGQVSRSAQRVLRCPHEDGWEDIDVRAELESAFDLPSIIENDCKLAALAEAILGAGRSQPTVFYITIGTGVGGGIVREGKIADFGDSGEAEIGHMVVMTQEGFSCPCGNKGCLETIASGPGLVQFARKLAKDHPSDGKGNTVSQRAIHDTKFTAKDLLDAYEQTEGFASAMMRIVATFTGQALASVIQLINPGVIVFGGGVGTASERYIKLVEEVTGPFVMPNLRGRCKFAMSQLRENVVTQGAGLLAAQTFVA